MFKSRTVNTVGELKKLLEQFPDDKPIIIPVGDFDDEGVTWPPEVFNWNQNADINDLNWPIGIR